MEFPRHAQIREPQSIIKVIEQWAEHDTVATLRCPADDLGPEHDFVTSIRYVDRLECRDGDWRIVRRVLILDWIRSDPVVKIEERPAVQPGRRDRTDASYLMR